MKVGMTAFEPTASSSRTKCATGLRYFPNGERCMKGLRFKTKFVKEKRTILFKRVSLLSLFPTGLFRNRG